MSAQSLTFATARAAVDAARSVEGVLDLSAGLVGEFTTYGGGERVPGVRVRISPEPIVALRLVVAYGRPLPELTDDVRDRVHAAVAPLLGRDVVPVNLDIVDVRLPGEPDAPPRTLAAPSSTPPGD